MFNYFCVLIGAIVLFVGAPALSVDTDTCEECCAQGCDQTIDTEPSFQTWCNYDRDTGVYWVGIEDIKNDIVVKVSSAGSQKNARRKAMHKLQALINMFLQEEKVPK